MANRPCPTCGQPWPAAKGRRCCCACLKPLGKHHRWFTGINNQPQHYNCDQPTRGPGSVPEEQPPMFVEVQ
jgi:hypothetical protein